MLERPHGPILLAGASTTQGSAEPVVAGAVKSVGGHAAVSNNGHVAQAADGLAAARARPSGDEPGESGNRGPHAARVDAQNLSGIMFAARSRPAAASVTRTRAGKCRMSVEIAPLQAAIVSRHDAPQP